MFINDLALKIKPYNTWVPIDDERVSILLYADDIILLAEMEAVLQYLLDVLYNWCLSNINTVEKYTYLGIALTEFLDYEITAKIVAQSINRALGLLIAKYKSIGGMPFEVFTKLYDSLVWPVISYGVAIWGTKSYSSINAVHSRAMRFFMGTGKYTPNAVVNGDIGGSHQ